jgi:hypothetical protein
MSCMAAREDDSNAMCLLCSIVERRSNSPFAAAVWASRKPGQQFAERRVSIDRVADFLPTRLKRPTSSKLFFVGSRESIVQEAIILRLV